MNYIRPYEVVDGDTHKVCFKGRDGEIYTLSASSSKGADFIGKGDLQNLFFPQLAETVPVKERTVSSDHEGAFQQFTLLVQSYDEPGTDSVTADAVRVNLVTDNDEIFDEGDTILVQGVYGYEEDQLTPSDRELVLYVLSRTDDEGLYVKAINGKKIGNVNGCTPSIMRGAVLIKMGKAASTVDATAIPETIPADYHAENYCQKFMSMLSEDSSKVNGVISEMSDLNETENRVLKNLVLMRDKSYLFGVKRLLTNADGELMYFTDGIWMQAGKEFTYSTDDEPTFQFLVDLCREAFVGSNNVPFSKAKYLIAGTQLASWIFRVLASTSGSPISYEFKNADWLELASPFGVLYITGNEVFDIVGRESDGLIVDLSFLKRYVMQPLRGDFVDFVDKDQNRVKGLVFSEESCMMITYPRSAMRVVCM